MILGSDDVKYVEYRATGAVDELARTLHDEIARSIKLLLEAREVLGHQGYYLRSLQPTGECVEDLQTIKAVIRLIEDATDVSFDDELPRVCKLVEEYKAASGYDVPTPPCEEEV